MIVPWTEDTVRKQISFPYGAMAGLNLLWYRTIGGVFGTGKIGCYNDFLLDETQKMKTKSPKLVRDLDQ